MPLSPGGYVSGRVAPLESKHGARPFCGPTENILGICSHFLLPEIRENFFFFPPLFLSSSGALALYQENLLEFQRANPQKNAAPGALSLLGNLSLYLVNPPGEQIKLCLIGFTCLQTQRGSLSRNIPGHGVSSLC